MDGAEPGSDGQHDGQDGDNPWADCTYLYCSDGKARRVGARIQCLALRRAGEIFSRLSTGEEVTYSASIALKCIGNGLCIPTAAFFIKTFMETVCQERE